MAKHHPDLIMCRKQPGIAIGRLCEKCDGKCVICDSYVRPCTLVRVCDECNYGSFQGRCVICGGVGISDAYYCKECTQQEKDRDGCPKIVNLGSAKTDLFYERKKYGFKKRWSGRWICLVLLVSLWFLLHDITAKSTALYSWSALILIWDSIADVCCNVTCMKWSTFSSLHLHLCSRYLMLMTMIVDMKCELRYGVHFSLILCILCISCSNDLIYGCQLGKTIIVQV